VRSAEGDTVIFSSSQIPGKGIGFGRIMNGLSDLGVITVTERQAHVHVSGHPGRPELAEMYRYMRPDILVPVHGEMRHMREQARFGLEQGVKSAIVQRNGDIIRLAPGGPQRIGVERTGRLVLDGDVILPADGTTINERRKMAYNGFIAVAVPIGKNGERVGDPVLRPFGVPVEEDRADFLADATDAAARAYEPGKDIEKVREAVRLAVRRCATLWTGKKPVVEVMLVETDR